MPSARAVHRHELIQSADHILFVLFIYSFFLSPAHLLTLIIRLTSQVQFGNPRQLHPDRSFRFFVGAWVAINGGNTLVHAIDGSQGTKGTGWSGKGIVLDFVGQAYTPTRLHLLAIDLVIAVLQFVLIVAAFDYYKGSSVSRGRRPSEADVAPTPAAPGPAADEQAQGEGTRLLAEIDGASERRVAQDDTDSSDEDDSELEGDDPKGEPSHAFVKPVISIRRRKVISELRGTSAGGDRVSSAMSAMEEGRA